MGLSTLSRDLGRIGVQSLIESSLSLLKVSDEGELDGAVIRKPSDGPGRLLSTHGSSLAPFRSAMRMATPVTRPTMSASLGYTKLRISYLELG